MKQIQQRIEELFYSQVIKTKDKQLIKTDQIIYFYYQDSKTFAVTDLEQFEINTKINDLDDFLTKDFLRIHRFYIVNFDHIIGISRSYDDKESFESLDYDLNLNYGYKVPISRTYEKRVKKALGIRKFGHLVPDNPESRRLRDLELIDFGMREVQTLDKTDPKAIEEFKKKFDIKQFKREKMLKYFRQVTYKEIDKPLIIKNIIWQIYRWITWGIDQPGEGNIRSLWYKIKAVLAYHSDIFEANDVSTFYSVLTSMIEDDKLFRYKDFGFLDMNEPYRGIGEEKPEIILASEKVGHYYFIKKMAMEIKCSFICLRGEPSHISIEYFSDALKEKLENKNVKVFSITDLDPAGSSIANNLIGELKKHGFEIERFEELVNTKTFSDEEFGFFRFPVVRYEKDGDQLTPLPPSNKAQLTKALNWYHDKINDKKLMTREKIEGRYVYTIFGVESDAADRMVLRKNFLALTAET